ncbi:hypothetical protein ACOI1H_16160 [Loktanella sp. DJP18]|uniref:hypothetical protein n=1 Tax=Loktanella sp. DJP18 TaxID=3409788 RepID=UPI003BB6179D
MNPDRDISTAPDGANHSHKDAAASDNGIWLLVIMGGMMWALIIGAVFWVLHITQILILPTTVKYILMAIGALPGLGLIALCQRIGRRQTTPRKPASSR